MVETGTAVCHDSGSALSDLQAHRRAATNAAAEVGARVLATASHPTADAAQVDFGNERRYQRIGARFGLLAGEALVCGCHVYVQVPSRDLGVAVCFGTDNVRDCWNPSTVTGMTDRVLLAAYRFDLRSDADLTALLDPVTAVPAKVAGLGPGTVAPGVRADLVAFDAACAPQVVVERQEPVLVLAKGAVAIDRRGPVAGTTPSPA